MTHIAKEKRRLKAWSRRDLMLLYVFIASLLKTDQVRARKKGGHKNRPRHKLTGKAKEAFLRRMNAGRRRKGLKPIRSRR